MHALDRARQLVSAYAGLDPPAWVLKARIELRMLEAGAPSAEDYAERLAREPAELLALCEALRVGETRFFRQQAHIDALRRIVIPELVGRAAGRARLSGWSAGCASGEEAFTLGMLLLEGSPAGTAVVLGTDISGAALAEARAGRYPAAAVAGVPPELRARWLEPEPEGHFYAVRPELAEVVRFEQRSLLGSALPQRVDLLLCRNVLIYFDRPRRERTLDRLVDCLAPGGYLLLGYAEFLRGREELCETLRLGEAVVYRRRERSAPLRPVAAPAAPAPQAARPPARPAGPEASEQAPELVRLDGVVADERACAARLRPAVGRPAVVLLDGAEFLGDEAAAALRRAAQAAPLVLVATRPGVLRWIGRTGLGEEVRVAPDVEAARRALAGAAA